MPLLVLDPTYSEETADWPLAPAPRSLAGRTVGLLDNGKKNSDRLLHFMGEVLLRDYGVSRVVRARKGDPSRPASAEVMAIFRECDALFTRVGD